MSRDYFDFRESLFRQPHEQPLFLLEIPRFVDGLDFLLHIRFTPLEEFKVKVCLRQTIGVGYLQRHDAQSVSRLRQ